MTKQLGTEPKTNDCPDCDGTGEVHSHNSKCPTCSGKGIASSDKIDHLDEQTDGRFPAGKSGIYRRW